MNPPRISNPLSVAVGMPVRALALAAGLLAGSASAAPANDDFVNAIDLTGTAVGQTGNLVEGDQDGTDNGSATLEVGEPSNPEHGTSNTVWFKWTSPAEGDFTVQTWGSTNLSFDEWDSVLGIYTGTSVDALTALGGSPQDGTVSEQMTVAVTAGTTYWIQLSGYFNDEATNIFLTWSFVAPVYPAEILSFGPRGAIGEAFGGAGEIAWAVPFGTNLSTLAPMFTLSPGATCDRISGEAPTPGFDAGPVIYTVTGLGESPLVNRYTVTVSVAPDESALVWAVGSGDWDFENDNWDGQTSGGPVVYSDALNVIFDQPGGGDISITDSVRPLTTTVSAASGTYTFSGSPIAEGSLSKSGNGQLVLSGSNSYRDGTVINGGILLMDLQADGALGSGPVTLNGGTLSLDRISCGNALIVNGGQLFADNGYGDNWNGAVTLNSDLTLGSPWYATLTFNDTIRGEGGLTLNGDGPVVLAVANTYSGTTNVNAGSLTCIDPDSLGSGTLNVGQAAKVKLNFSGTKKVSFLTLGGVAKTVFGTYGSLESDADFKSSFFEGAGTVTTGVIPVLITEFGANVAGSSALIDPVVANAANIDWTVPFGTDLATLAPTFSLSPGATCDRVSGVIPTPNLSAGPVVYTVVSADGTIINRYTVTATALPDETTLVWGLAGGGAWNYSSVNWNGQTFGAPTRFYDEFNVVFDNTAGGTIAIEPGMSPVSTQVSAASGTYTFTGGPIATGTLVKEGGGTLTIKGNNTYRGGTTINGGTLRVDYVLPNTDSGLGSGPVTLNGGQLYLWRINASNDLIINGGNVYSENGFGNNWNGPITLNADLICNTVFAMKCSNTISGPGGVVKSGSNTLTLSGTNSYSGPTTVSAGTLKCDQSDALGGGALSINSGGAKLNLNFVGTRGVSSLLLGGVVQAAPGTYGSSESQADFPNDEYFVGSGTVTVVGGGGYDSWSGGAAFDGDSNNDGVANGLVWLLGATQPTSSGSALLPVVTQSGGGLVLTFDCLSAANRGSSLLSVQYSTDLGQTDAWVSAAVPGVVGSSNVGAVHFEVTASGDHLHVIATIQAGEAVYGKLFGRLVGQK
jgi:autotransporter-associated beta strand protein